MGMVESLGWRMYTEVTIPFKYCPFLSEPWLTVNCYTVYEGKTRMWPATTTSKLPRILESGKTMWHRDILEQLRPNLARPIKDISFCRMSLRTIIWLKHTQRIRLVLTWPVTLGMSRQDLDVLHLLVWVQPFTKKRWLSRPQRRAALI